jgi:Protein of unknown function (DUF3489)
MRSYLIDANHVTVSREPPLEPHEDEIAVASLDELLAARLTSKQLLSLWNGLPGVEKRTRMGDRQALVANLWSAMEVLPDPETVEQRRSKQADVVAMLRRPEGVTVDEIRAVTGWQAHTVRGVFSGALKKKLGLAIASAKEERGRVYRITAQADA